MERKHRVSSSSKSRVGHCRFWYDNWTPYGCLEDYYVAGGNSRLGIPRQAVLADLSRNGNWCLPHPRTDNQLQVVSLRVRSTVLCEAPPLRFRGHLRYGSQEVSLDILSLRGSLCRIDVQPGIA